MSGSPIAPELEANTGPGGRLPLVSVGWLRDRLGGGKTDAARLRLIHVSPNRRVFVRRHLPRAIFCDLHRELALRGRAVETGDVEREWLVPSREAAEALLRRWAVGTDDDIVFYDDIGQNRQAIRGYWLLRLYRFPQERLHVLDGGLKAWVAAGCGVEAGREDPATLEALEAHGPAPELGERDSTLVATADEVLAWSREASQIDGPTRLLDVRSADEYLGRDVRAARGGHIPGARHRVFDELLTAEGTLRPPGDILALLRGGGVEPADVRATYCQGGVRAALAWFALHELAGLQGVRSYAGSWEEWGNRPELPIEVAAAD